MFSFSNEFENDKGVEGSKMLQVTSIFNNKIRDTIYEIRNKDINYFGKNYTPI